MGTIAVQFDFAEYGRRNSAGARHAAHTKKWMAAQTTNVVQEARDPLTPPMRLRELAMNGNAQVRISVAGNAAADAATLVFLSTTDIITSAISQKLTKNPNSPGQALLNVKHSTFYTWFGNRDRIAAHPNWSASN